MSDSAAPDASADASQALRRGLLIRLGLAAAALIALAVFTLDLFAPRAPGPQEKRLVVEAPAPLAAVDRAPAPEHNEAAPAATPATPAADAQQAERNALPAGQGEGPSQPANPTVPVVSSKVQAGAAQSDGGADAAQGDAGGAAKASAGDVALPEPPSEPAAEAKAQSPVRAASAPARGPHLQAGVFIQSANAQALKATLEAQGLPVYIESRVHVGPFRDRKEAERMRQKLKEMGIATVLVTK